MELSEFVSRRQAIETASGPLSFVDIGDGPPAVFVHGVSMNGALWRRVMGALSGDYRCISFDLPSHGLSPARPDHDYSLAVLATTLRDFLDALGLAEAHLIASDTGGAVAQVFAAHHPERLTTLALTNCDTIGNLPPRLFAGTVRLARAGKFAGRASRWVDDLDLARSARNIGSGYRDPAYLTDDAIIDYLTPVTGTLEAAREFEHFLVGALREGGLAAAEQGLAELNVPTLIVWGDADPYFDVEWAYRLAELIPGAAQPIVISGASLFFADEQPEVLVPNLQRHWAATA